VRNNRNRLRIWRWGLSGALKKVWGIHLTGGVIEEIIGYMRGA
jgi:hypothetical protein